MYSKDDKLIDKYCILEISNITGPTANYSDQGSWAISVENPTQMEVRCTTHTHPPYGDYIVAIEKACSTMEPNSAEELRAEIRGALKHTHPTRSNINWEEVQAIVELKRDSTKVILTADKGVALVMMDKPNYNTKAQELLNDMKTYKEINTDPTNKLKSKLISLLKKIKTEGRIEEQLYKKMYPIGAVAPKFYGLPKIHKRDIPFETNCIQQGFN